MSVVSNGAVADTDDELENELETMGSPQLDQNEETPENDLSPDRKKLVRTHDCSSAMSL